MNPELEQAIRERVDLGHSKEQIADELRQAGYDEQTIEHVYTAVTANAGEMAAAPVPPVATGVLPAPTTLFGQGWNFMISRLDLVAALAAPSIVLGVVQYGAGQGASIIPGQGILILVGVLVAIAAMILMQVTVVHAAVMQRTQGVASSIADSFAWARRNVWAWLWLVILSTLVVSGGFALLIVPGIIAAMYMALAQPIFVAEGTRGLAALQRSRALLYGQFWAVFGRLIVFGLFVFLLYIPVMVLAVVLAGVDGAGDNPPMLFGIIEGLMSGVVGVMSAHFIAGMYVAVRNNPTSIAPTGWYKAYAWIGVVSVVLYFLLIGVVVGIMATSGMGAFDGEFDMESLQQEMTPEEQAEFEAFMEEFGEEFGSGETPG